MSRQVLPEKKHALWRYPAVEGADSYEKDDPAQGVKWGKNGCTII